MKQNTLQNKIEIKKFSHCEELLCELSKIAFNYKAFKELTYPVFSDENHTWFLMYKNGILIGFCAMVLKGNKIKFTHDYVLETERNNGYYDLLFKERYSNAKGVINAVATNKSLSTFLRYGFNIEKKTKNFNFVSTYKNNNSKEIN